jgi:hypothetical protein
MINRERNIREESDNMNELIGMMYTRDLLQELSDSDLRQAESAVNSLRAKNKKTYEYEIELCYIQDEINRRVTAANWLNNKNETASI